MHDSLPPILLGCRLRHCARTVGHSSGSSSVLKGMFKFSYRMNGPSRRHDASQWWDRWRLKRPILGEQARPEMSHVCVVEHCIAGSKLYLLFYKASCTLASNSTSTRSMLLKSTESTVRSTESTSWTCRSILSTARSILSTRSTRLVTKSRSRLCRQCVLGIRLVYDDTFLLVLFRCAVPLPLHVDLSAAKISHSVWSILQALKLTRSWSLYFLNFRPPTSRSASGTIFPARWSWELRPAICGLRIL